MTTLSGVLLIWIIGIYILNIVLAVRITKLENALKQTHHANLLEE